MNPQIIDLLNQLQQKREQISNYGYRTGRTNDRNIEKMEWEFIRLGIDLSDCWRDCKKENETR